MYSTAFHRKYKLLNFQEASTAELLWILNRFGILWITFFALNTPESFRILYSWWQTLGFSCMLSYDIRLGQIWKHFFRFWTIYGHFRRCIYYTMKMIGWVGRVAATVKRNGKYVAIIWDEFAVRNEFLLILGTRTTGQWKLNTCI